MAERFKSPDGRTCTWYQCGDCGMRLDVLADNSMRPNNKFCNIDCMAYVLEHRLQALYDSPRPRGYKAWLENYRNNLALS